MQKLNVQDDTISVLVAERERYYSEETVNYWVSSGPARLNSQTSLHL